jgi:hypothetical protein
MKKAAGNRRPFLLDEIITPKRHPEERAFARVSKDGPQSWPWFETAQVRLLTMRLCCAARVLLRPTLPQIRPHPEERP